MSEKRVVHFPLQLKWTLTRKSHPLVFDYKYQQLDNFALMMAGLCQDSRLISSRVSSLLTELFEIHNRLYCSTEETTKTMTPEKLKKAELLVQEIDQEMIELDVAALKVCSEAVVVSSTQVVWKYLIAILHGLKAETYFVVGEIDEGNKERMEMFKLIHHHELFETLDLIDMIMDHCSQLLTLLWSDTKTKLTQIDYLLNVARHLLNNVSLDDDLDGLKYQNLRKYWHLIVALNEGRFIDKSWKAFESKELNSSFEECLTMTIPDLPEPPKILTHTSSMNHSDDFLDRKTALENHKPNMVQWSPLQVTSGQDSFSIFMEVLNYAQIAYDAVKTQDD